MISAVYFDMGGVLLRSESEELRRKWERQLGLPKGRLAEIVFDNPVAARATVGQAETHEVWAEVGRQLGLDAPAQAALQAEFFAGDAFDVDLLSYIRSLRPRYKTGLISNAWPDVRSATQSCLNATTFDLVLFSGEEKVRKPDPVIYRRALDRLAVTPETAVFVDDVLENVTAAQALGMTGIQFRSPAQVRGELDKLLV